MPDEKGIRVTVTDLETGESDRIEFRKSCVFYERYDLRGTEVHADRDGRHVLTIKHCGTELEQVLSREPDAERNGGEDA